MNIMEYKQKTGRPNLYEMLGLTIDVCQDPNCNEIIEKAYLKKAKVINPGKYPGRKDVEELFELITNIYEILRDEKQRVAYNHTLTLNKSSSGDFLKLKKGASDYSETVGQYVPANDQQKLSFKGQMTALNSKHGYDSSQTDAIGKGEAKRRLHDLTRVRSGQDREYMPEKLFNGTEFDSAKFNAAFDRTHNRSSDSIVPSNGVPSAWNDLGSTANFSSFDDLDNIYVEDSSRFDTSRQIYGSIDFAEPLTKFTKEDMLNIQGADYVRGHSDLDNNYYRDMKTKLRERKSDAGSFESMSYGDFRRDDTAGYGIFDQLGLKFDDTLALDVDDDISAKFERLMAERQKDILPITQEIPKSKNNNNNNNNNNTSR